jgi:hypothetical protein
MNKVILNWWSPLWEREQEVVKRSGRDEPAWFSIHVHGKNMRHLPV